MTTYTLKYADGREVTDAEPYLKAALDFAMEGMTRLPGNPNRAEVVMRLMNFAGRLMELAIESAPREVESLMMAQARESMRQCDPFTMHGELVNEEGKTVRRFSYSIPMAKAQARYGIEP